MMSLMRLLNPILDNEHLTRGLGDAEARLLIEWLVERTEEKHAAGIDSLDLMREIDRLCGKARAIARFVFLWCHQNTHAAACQLAATERFGWPLPCAAMDPYDLMAHILAWEQYPERDPNDI